MILRRIGNKSAVADHIQKYFPSHDIYLEPFFGAGGMFFNKPKVKYNFLNDVDADVYNLYRTITDQPDLLLKELQVVPIHQKLFNEWVVNLKPETDPILRAVRFLILSNFSLHGKMDTLRIGMNNTKQIMLDNLEPTRRYLGDCYFTNCDFREFFGKISYSDDDRPRAFCYADPPYLDTTSTYSHPYVEQDASDLFDTLQASGMRWAMSEFSHPFIIEQARARELVVTEVFRGRNLTSTKMKVEILITNYVTPQLTLF